MKKASFVLSGVGYGLILPLVATVTAELIACLLQDQIAAMQLFTYLVLIACFSTFFIHMGDSMRKDLQSIAKEKIAPRVPFPWDLAEK